VEISLDAVKTTTLKKKKINDAVYITSTSLRLTAFEHETDAFETCDGSYNNN